MGGDSVNSFYTIVYVKQLPFWIFVQDGGGLLPPSSSSKHNSTEIAHEDLQRMVTKKRVGSPVSATTPTSSVQVNDVQLPVKQVLCFSYRLYNIEWGGLYVIGI